MNRTTELPAYNLIETTPSGGLYEGEEAVDCPRLISQLVSEDIVRVYRGWHSYEGDHGGPSIVDFDLSDFEGTSNFESRIEILDKLGELNDRLINDSCMEALFLRRRLEGSIMYLRALMGDQIDFFSYVSATLGVEPLPIPENEIAKAKRNVELELEARGLKLTASFRSALDENFFTKPEEIKQSILSQRSIWLARLKKAGIPVSEQLPLAVKFDNIDAYWSNWIDGSSRHGLTLTINLHKRVRYDEGRALFLCLHEICGHAAQMSIWRNRIRSGKISQACGVTNVHSPEMFLAEGLGQTVPDLLNEYEFSSTFKINRALRYHTLLLMHNAHLRLYKGVSARVLVSELCEQLPFSKPEELEAQLRDRGTNLLFRTYLLSYSAGENLIRTLVEANPEVKKRLFRMIYTTPMTPQQLIDYSSSHQTVVASTL